MQMPSLPTLKMPSMASGMETLQGMRSGMSIPSPSSLLKQFKSLIEMESDDTEATPFPRGTPIRGKAPDAASAGRSGSSLDSDDGNELVDVSWMKMRSAPPPEGGYIDEREYPGVPYHKVNEVALRLEEIARTMSQMEYDKAHPEERRQQVRSELEAGAAARNRVAAVCSCAVVCDCGHDMDNASTVLSNLETDSNASELCDHLTPCPERAQRHVVQPLDTLGGICIMYGVTASQLMKTNKAFNQQSLLARREIKIPSNVSQMDAA